MTDERKRERTAMVRTDMRQLGVLIMTAAVIGVFIEPVTPWAGIGAALGLVTWYLAIWKL